MIQGKSSTHLKAGRTLRYLARVVTFSVCAAVVFAPSAQAGGMSKGLAAKMANAGAAEQVSVIVRLPQAPVPKVASWLRGKARAKAMASSLKAGAEAARMRLMGDVTYQANRGAISHVQPLWLANAVAMKATPAAISELMAAYPGADVTLNRPIKTPEGLSPLGNVNGSGTVADAWNLTTLEATDMWALGYKGQDVVVAFMDTGIDVDHTALAMSAFEGGANSWCDTVEPDPANPVGGCPGTAVPSEVVSNAHGTGVASVIFGGTVTDSVSGNPVALGVAPEARWVGVRVFNNEGGATEADAIAGMGWLAGLANPPQVLNLSWEVDTSPNGGNCLNKKLVDVGTVLADPLRVALANLRNNLDIFVVAAAGNSNVAVLPAAFYEVYAVGATRPDDSIWPGSGRVNSGDGMSCEFRSLGAALLGGTDMANKPYPDAVAPGELVIHADFSSGGVLETTRTNAGTSYSAPHAAGAAALLLSAFPDMTAADLEKVLSFAAVLATGQTGLDNTHGFGLLKAKQSLDLALVVDTPAISVSDDYVQLARAPRAWLTLSGNDVTVHWNPPPLPPGVSVDYTIFKNGSLVALTSGETGTSYVDLGAGATTVGFYNVVVHDVAATVPDSAATVALLGNVNRMGGASAQRVDGFDLMAMRNAVATGTGDSNFISLHDLNGDGSVTGADMTLLQTHMGHRVTP